MGSPIRLPFSWWLLCWTALGGCHMNPQSLNWFCHYIKILVEHTLLFNGFHILGSPMRLPFAWWMLCWTALEGCHMNLQPILSLHVDVGWTLDSEVFPKGSGLAWWGCDLRSLCKFWAAVSDEGPIRLPFAWWMLCWTALEGWHIDPQSFLCGLDTFKAWPDDDDDPIWEPSAGSELLIKDLNGKKVLFH